MAWCMAHTLYYDNAFRVRCLVVWPACYIMTVLSGHMARLHGPFRAWCPLSHSQVWHSCYWCCWKEWAFLVFSGCLSDSVRVLLRFCGLSDLIRKVCDCTTHPWLNISACTNNILWTRCYHYYYCYCCCCCYVKEIGQEDKLWKKPVELIVEKLV